MIKDVLIGIGAGLAILLVGAGLVIAQRPALSPAQGEAMLSAQILAMARRAERPGQPALDRLRENLDFALQSPTTSVREFCRNSPDTDTCRVGQYSGNRAVITIYRQLMVRADDIEASIANLCTEIQTNNGLTDWRGTVDCFVNGRRRLATETATQL